MNKLEVACPGCGRTQWTAESVQGHQTNCEACGRVFTVTAAPRRLADTKSLRLVLGPDAVEETNPYRILADQGISPDSRLVDIQKKVFAYTDELDQAQRTLQTIKNRLKVDWFLYPVWEDKE